jgi:peptidoglycan/xylan/chitin deacetylase (PgdA/CDA1 family)
MSRPSALLSVDVEFFSHLPAYRSASGTTDETGIGRDGIEFLLNAFASADAIGTFFVVSDIAESHPNVISSIASQHELGSHTHTHRHLSALPTADRRAELSDSRDRLEAVSAAEVTSFRAPSFDFADDHFEMLAEVGYEYDSSIVSCRSIPGWYGGDYEIQRPTLASDLKLNAPNTLTEIPVSVMPWLRLPLTGTWIRFFGVRYTLLGMRWLAKRDITPVLYVHPWELVDLPAVEGVPSRVYFRTGAYMRQAINRILDTDFEFITVRQLAKQARGDKRDQPGKEPSR